ncbi:MAG: radical SAM family heme chaperone HemW [Ferruginibacter sp.]
MSGVYIHIPFCKQACHYCNFHFSTSTGLKKQFLAALLKEIYLTAAPSNAPLPQNKRESCETIYFGGGTPSILDITEVTMIIEALHKYFFVDENAEVTLEANPDDITPAKLIQWKNAGINRLSVGIQSFADDELRWMNRAHTAVDSLRCIKDIQEAGFTNYSIDLIYGSPLLSNEKWKANVKTVVENKVPHISCYGLTVEPKTALDSMIAQKKMAPVDPERQAAQFLLLMDWMEAAGYEHYEISNFALPGMHSRHNSSYWQGRKYYGFGPSAHSFDVVSRRWNIANNALYIKSLENDRIPFEQEMLTSNQQLNEYIMTSLRTQEGIDLEKVNHQFGEKFSVGLLRSSIKYTENNQMDNSKSHLILTKSGKLFADGIAADLFF